MYSLAEDKIVEQKSRTKNLKYVNYLENYLKDKLTLRSGVNAPEFYSQEISSEIKRLNDYKRECSSIKLLVPWLYSLV